MPNDVEIRVKVRDDTKAGWASSRAGAAMFQRQLETLRQKGFSPLMTTAMALGPAVVPVLGAATVAAGGFGVAIASAGAALGVFGAVTKSAFAEVSEASKKNDDLRKKIELLNEKMKDAEGTKAFKALAKQRDKALDEQAARLRLLPAPVRAAVSSFDKLRGTWEKFVTANRTPTLAIMTRSFGILASIIPKLQPLFAAASKQVSLFVGLVDRWNKSGGSDRLINFFAQRAPSAIGHFVNIMRNVTVGVGNLFGAMDVSTGGVLRSLDNMSARFRNWSAGPAFTNFVQSIKDNAPETKEFLASIGAAAKNLAIATAPLVPISTAVAQSLAQIIAAIPPDKLTLVVGGFVAYAVAMRAYTAAVLAASVATKVLAVSMGALNLIFAANPIVGAAVAVAAFAAAFYVLYQRFEAFRKVAPLVLLPFSLLGGIILAVVQHVNTLRDVFGAAFEAIGVGVLGAVRFMADSLFGFLEGILRAAAKLPGPLGKPFTAAADAVAAMRQSTDRNITAAQTRVKQFADTIRSVPKHATITATASTNAAENALNRVARDRNAYVNVIARPVGPSVGGVGRMYAQAHGGIQGAASGGARSAWTWVGERGPELVKLPAGSTVRNADASRRMAGGAGQPAVVHLTIDSGGARIDDVLVDLLQRAVRLRGGGNVQLALGQP